MASVSNDEGRTPRPPAPVAPASRRGLMLVVATVGFAVNFCRSALSAQSRVCRIFDAVRGDGVPQGAA